MEWMLLPLRRYADFSGRSRRQEYWMFQLFLALLSLPLVLWLYISFFNSLFSQGASGGAQFFQSWGFLTSLFLLIALSLATIVPLLAVTVRRFHDQGLSGWYVLLGLIPFIGGIILMVFMCLPGTTGDNAYGPDPKNAGLTPSLGGHDAQISAAVASGGVQRLNISGFGPSGHVIRQILDPQNWPYHGRGMTIGRSPMADLPIFEATISRDHAEIHLQQDGFYIRDLGSTNGSVVNGQLLAPHETMKLWPGDTLTLGSLELLVTVV